MLLNSIGSKELDARQCLYYLSHYTRGMAKILFLTFMILEIHFKAQNVKTLLIEQLDNLLKQASGFISKITERPSSNTNNSIELSAFAVDIEVCAG